jgi:hypothetical protein
VLTRPAFRFYESGYGRSAPSHSVSSCLAGITLLTECACTTATRSEPDLVPSHPPAAASAAPGASLPAARYELSGHALLDIEGQHLRIGSWWLQAEGDELRLMQRMGPHPVSLFYTASVRRAAGRWQVSGLGPGEIFWKR